MSYGTIIEFGMNDDLIAPSFSNSKAYTIIKLLPRVEANLSQTPSKADFFKKGKKY